MRVVLVDPSRTMRLFVTRLLEARDHEVRPFADGPDALACMHADAAIGALITSSELDSMSAWSCAGRPACSPGATGRST